MLAYQHAYHAGNVADVHKHIALFILQQRLQEKASAVTYVDTHAGRGLYPLDAQETQRGAEYIDGILPLWQRRERLSDNNPLLDAWFMRLDSLNPRPALECYPGSPWWFADGMRDQDRLQIFELHPGELDHLDTSLNMLPRGQIQRTHGDGLAGLVNALPVPTPRLCVLIDPSYEIKSEYVQVAETLKAVADKVRHAIVMIWYPLLPQQRHEALKDAVAASGVRKVWQSEFMFKDPHQGRGLYGSGLLIFNPPWQLPEQLDRTFSELAAFYGVQARHESTWCVPES